MIDLNLAPWRENLKLKERRLHWLELIVGLLLALLISILLRWILCGQLKETKLRIFRLQERLQTMNKRMEEARGLTLATEYQKNPEMNLNFILNQQGHIFYFLQNLASLLPATVILKKIQLENNFWNIEGVSDGINAIWLYADQLQSCFKKMNSLDIKQKDGQFNFQLKLEMLT